MQSRFKILLGICFKIVLIGLLIVKMYFLSAHSHASHFIINSLFFSLCIWHVYLSFTSINYIGAVIGICCALAINPFYRWGLALQGRHFIDYLFIIFFIIWIILDVIFILEDLKFRKKFNQYTGLFDRI